jgi:Tol biopolymer transport system component
VATTARVSSSPRKVPILDRLAEDKDVETFATGTERASALRFGGDSVFFLSSSDGWDGLWWQDRDKKPAEVWKDKDGALVEPPVVSPDGKQVAFVRPRNGRPVWHVCLADCTRPRSVGDDIDIHGSATWSPDGKSLLVGGSNAQGPGLFRIPVADGGSPTRMVSGVALNPAWSKDDLIVYAGADVKSAAPLSFIRPNGDRVEFPPIDVTGAQTGRFLPDGKGFIYRQGNFYRLDLLTKERRQLTRLTLPSSSGSFDVTPDGKSIVFDWQRKNSDISLIDLAPK